MLCGDEADGFVPSNEFGASRHSGEDDVPAQSTDAAGRGREREGEQRERENE